MPCYIVPEDDGGYMILCGDLGPHCSAEKCSAAADFLCDYPVGDAKTCDLPLCKSHACEVAPNIHYCPGHLVLWQEFCESNRMAVELGNVSPFENVVPFKKL